LDIETTGINPRKDEILEFGYVITDLKLNTIDRHKWLVWGPKHEAAAKGAIPFVQQMHTKNGLWSEAEKKGIWFEDVMSEFAELMVPHGIDKTDPLCGSSVQMDRDFLTVRAPKMMGSMFSYRNIDVSSIKETVERFRPALAQARDATLISRKNHRVFDCLNDTIEEYRFYLLHMGLLGGGR
jgi:oligoribonuclease